MITTTLTIAFIVILLVSILHFKLKSGKLKVQIEALEYNLKQTKGDLTAWKRRAMYMENMSASELNNYCESKIETQVYNYIPHSPGYWKGHKFIAENMSIPEELVKKAIHRLVKQKLVKLKQVRSLDGEHAIGTGYVKVSKNVGKVD